MCVCPSSPSAHAPSDFAVGHMQVFSRMHKNMMPVIASWRPRASSSMATRYLATTRRYKCARRAAQCADTMEDWRVYSALYSKG